MTHAPSLATAAFTAGAIAALTIAAAAPSYAERPGPKMPGDHSDLPLTFAAGVVCVVRPIPLQRRPAVGLVLGTYENICNVVECEFLRSSVATWGA